MPSFEPERLAKRGLPPRRPPFLSRDEWGRVQPQTGNHREGVTIACIDRDPFAAPSLTIFSKFGRAHRRFDYSGATERIRNGAGTIVGGIMEGFVTAAVAIRFGMQLIRSPDGALHF